LLLCLVIPLAAASVFVYLLETNLAPIVLKIAEVRAENWATKTVTQVIHEQVIPGLTYETLIKIERDNSGRVSFMQPNTAEINKVMAGAITSIQDALRQKEEFQILVPINQVFGAEMYLNIGPRITATVTAVGSVSGSISEEFTQAGINQVRHVIYLEIHSQMHIVVPFVTSGKELVTRLPLTQAVIVGAVPQTYVRIGP
jgi:sporulation protein YunB